MDVNKRKKVTMGDIAERLQISKNAVSLALNNRPGVSESLRQQVREVADKLNYGRLPTLQDSSHSCIVVLVPEYIRNDSYFYSDVFWSIEHETRKVGKATLMLGLSRKAEQHCTMPDIPDTLQVLGYLTIGIISKEYLAALITLGKPIISVDIHHNGLPIPTIGSDNIGGAYSAAEYLVEAGHKQIGFIGPIYVAQSVYERWCGFQQAMSHARLPVYEEYCILGSHDSFELLDNAEVLNKYLSKLSVFPTAWLCAGDLIAVSLLGLLNEQGVRVPEDISIIGYDNLKISEMVTPALTTVHVDRNLIGKTAVQHLVQQIEKTPAPTCIISLTSKLVLRNSVNKLEAAPSLIKA